MMGPFVHLLGARINVEQWWNDGVRGKQKCPGIECCIPSVMFEHRYAGVDRAAGS